MSKYDPRLYNGEALIERVSGTLSRYSMCAPGQHVAVAVSGGADSVCLLYILHELSPTLGITLSVAHVNHKLRGTESDEDADFVREMAARLGFPFHYRETDLAAASENLEQAGRRVRFAFFNEIQADRVATGHTRSDQAETVLYRLLRGSGTAGLAAIVPVVNGRIIRPLFECSREEAVCFLQHRGLAWREDSSNATLDFARNRIRREILPRVRLEQPAIDEILARTADLARDEEAYWSAEVARLEPKYLIQKDKGVLINADELGELPIALQRRMLRRAVYLIKGDLREVTLFHVERLMSLSTQREGHGRVQAPGIDVFRSFNWLRFAAPRTESRFERDYCLALTVPGLTGIPGQEAILSVEVAENTTYSERHEGYNNDSIDTDRLSGLLELRNWRPGDQFQRVGHSIDKIKTLFQLARVPIWERQGWPVITSGERIVWTRKFGVSAEFAAARDSRRILRIVEGTESAESNMPDSASLY